MIPIRDDAPRFSTPYVNYFLLALNIVVFLAMWIGIPAPAQQVVNVFGFRPVLLTALLVNHNTSAGIGAMVTIFTSMFMHAGWLHLIGNMWVLYIFGDNIEDYLGHFPYQIIFDVVAEDIKHPHVSDQVQPSCVHEHGCENGDHRTDTSAGIVIHQQRRQKHRTKAKNIYHLLRGRRNSDPHGEEHHDIERQEKVIHVGRAEAGSVVADRNHLAVGSLVDRMPGNLQHSRQTMNGVL